MSRFAGTMARSERRSDWLFAVASRTRLATHKQSILAHTGKVPEGVDLTVRTLGVCVARDGLAGRRTRWSELPFLKRIDGGRWMKDDV
jgi:hypothetical protein